MTVSMLLTRCSVSGDSDDEEDQHEEEDNEELLCGNICSVSQSTMCLIVKYRRIALICVCPLSDEEGFQSYCNTPLKLFRCTKSESSAWSTSTAVAHFKKHHPRSNVSYKQKGKLETRQGRLVECIHTLSVVARWGTYVNMKVSQAAFADPFFVVILQAV